MKFELNWLTLLFLINPFLNAIDRWRLMQVNTECRSYMKKPQVWLDVRDTTNENDQDDDDILENPNFVLCMAPIWTLVTLDRFEINSKHTIHPALYVWPRNLTIFGVNKLVIKTDSWYLVFHALSYWNS